MFDYHLPRELIAQFPGRHRDRSRLLVLDRSGGDRCYTSFLKIGDYIKEGDALVVNNTKVFKARLLGRRVTGAVVEVFLVRHLEDSDGEEWEALVRPSRKLNEGEKVVFNDGLFLHLAAHISGGRWRVGFSSKTTAQKIITRHGHVPLPQYIKREDQRSDIRRYQTVFADKTKVGAVAAPTAGFHFSRRFLRRLEERGVKIFEVTLHVGPGTFKPITSADIDDHIVDPEWAELPLQVAEGLNAVRANGGSIFAVGTTSVRTLESAPMAGGYIQPFAAMVDLYIRPGHRFQYVDHLITNFHLPKSSLLVLVSAFAGHEQILDTYTEAIQRRYRFYSYGDAMLIL